MTAVRPDNAQGRCCRLSPDLKSEAFVPGARSRDGEGPVVREPWEAQAFATAWRSAGADFSAGESGPRCGAKKSSQRGGPAIQIPAAFTDTYYCHRLAALERMVAHKGIADRATLKRYHDAWERAASHAAPIELRAADFAAE